MYLNLLSMLMWFVPVIAIAVIVLKLRSLR